MAYQNHWAVLSIDSRHNGVNVLAETDAGPGRISGFQPWKSERVDLVSSGNQLGITSSHDDASNQNPGTRMMSMTGTIRRNGAGRQAIAVPEARRWKGSGLPPGKFSGRQAPIQLTVLGPAEYSSSAAASQLPAADP